MANTIRRTQFSLMFPFIKTEALAPSLMVSVNGGGGGGGGTGTPPAGLNASFNLDKTIYSPGETITVTSSVYYVACSNATRDIVVTGYITNGSTYTSSTKTLYSGLVKGGDSPIYSTSTFTAPATEGIYTLKVEIKGYVPASYEMNDSFGSIYSSNFYSFRSSLMDYVNNYYSQSSLFEDAITIIYLAKNINDLYSLQSVINTMTIFSNPSYLDFTRYYDLSFVVQAPPTVELSVNGSTADPQTITSGEPVQVNWIAQNATGGCTCSTNTLVKLNDDDPRVVPSYYCGNSIGALGRSESFFYNIYGVTSQTVFTVSCNND